MSFKALYCISTLILVTFLGTPMLSYAAPLCAQVFEGTPAQWARDLTEKQALFAATKLLNKNNELTQFVLGGKGTITNQSQFQDRIDEIDQLAKKYFAVAGIRVVREMKEFQNIQVEDIVIPKLSLPVYRVYHSSGSTQRGRVLNGVALLGLKKEFQVIFNPFQIVSVKALAYFSPEANAIFYKPGGLYLDHIGRSHALRHELNHAVDFSNLHAGKKTLASFVLAKNSLGRPDSMSYVRQFNFSEIESFLRDARFFKISEDMSEPFRKNNSEVEGIEKESREFKEYGYKTSVEFVRFFVSEGRAAIQELLQKTPSYTSGVDVQGTKHFYFKNLKKSKYQNFELLLKLDADSDASEAIVTNLKWALERLKAVEEELQKLDAMPFVWQKNKAPAEDQ